MYTVLSETYTVESKFSSLLIIDGSYDVEREKYKKGYTKNFVIVGISVASAFE